MNFNERGANYQEGGREGEMEGVRERERSDRIILTNPPLGVQGGRNGAAVHPRYTRQSKA